MSGMPHECARLLAASLMVAVFGIADPLHAQHPERADALEVTLIIPEDYPAFDVAFARARGVEPIRLRALILRLPPWGEGKAAILLNPEYASPGALHAAVRALRRSVERGGVTRNIAVRADDGGVTGPTTEGRGGELDRALGVLWSQPTESITEIGTSGRRLVLGDLRRLGH
jgi:hypothetical protein